MAASTTVQSLYDAACYVLLEDGGLSLGLVTPQQFLDNFAVVLGEFLARTGMVWTVYTQQITTGTAQYPVPRYVNSVRGVFVAGQWIDHATQRDLDDWSYGWQNTANGQPMFWYDDGLPAKMVAITPAPNWTGTSYSPSAGIDNSFDPGSLNLTVVGPQGVTSNSWLLSSTIPVVPDALCFYLGYGVLARIFSMDGEAKDEQRAAYCLARYTEGINLCAAIGGELMAN